MTRTVLVLLSTARRLRLGPCTPLGSGGEAHLMRWACSLQVVTCSGRNGCGSLSRSLLSSLGWHCMCCACSFEQHLIATRSWIWPTRRCETRLSRRGMWVISLFL
jgi:hypothetical protein